MAKLNFMNYLSPEEYLTLKNSSLFEIELVEDLTSFYKEKYPLLKEAKARFVFTHNTFAEILFPAELLE
ncbi:hypothetical protein LJB92_03460 [Bacteroidales bacterium OttesenSCG-928-M06]|nr:hypothetical protein [Bacteroidales bacterium OttesenSCG-928-M06]